MLVNDANSWNVDALKPPEQPLTIPLTEIELETVRAGATRRHFPPAITAQEWDTATLVDVGRLREAYRRIESQLKIEKQYSEKASTAMNDVAQREVALMERVAQLESENEAMKTSLAESKLETEELKLQIEQLTTSLQARNQEIREFNVHQTIGRSELEKKHFEDTDVLRQKLNDVLRQKAADSDQWAKERNTYQTDIGTLKNRLDRFLATEVTLYRLVSLCAHVQEAIQSLLIAGRLFDATYRSLRRQQRTIAEEQSEQLQRAVGLHLRGFDAEAQDIYEGLFGNDPEDLDVLYSYTHFLAYGLGDTKSALRVIKASQEARTAQPRRQTARTLAETLLEQLLAELRRNRTALLALHQHVQQECAAAVDAAGLAVSGMLLAAAAADVPSARGWTLQTDART
jgi:hypothetical protein